MVRIDRRGLATALALAMLAGAATSCGAARPAQTSQPATPRPTGAAFEKAKAECSERAIRETEHIGNQDVASKSAIGIYQRCLEEKGFGPATR